jgi:hypothetical protein
LFTTQPVSFDAGLIAYPEMLKIMVGIAAAGLLGLAALVRFVLRRVRRRNASLQKGKEAITTTQTI